MALKPDGIVLGGFDATEQAAAIERRGQAGHPAGRLALAGANPGPMPRGPVFANVTTDRCDVAWWPPPSATRAEAGGKAGVAIFTDSHYAIAVRKADAMAAVIKRAAAARCSIRRHPDRRGLDRMPPLTTSLLQRTATRGPTALAINDLYFDFMGRRSPRAGLERRRPAEAVVGRRRRGRLPAHPRQALPGGDGRRAAAAAGLAAGRRAEPRARQGGVVGLRAQLHLVTAENVG